MGKDGDHVPLVEPLEATLRKLLDAACRADRGGGYRSQWVLAVAARHGDHPGNQPEIRGMCKTSCGGVSCKRVSGSRRCRQSLQAEQRILFVFPAKFESERRGASLAAYPSTTLLEPPNPGVTPFVLLVLLASTDMSSNAGSPVTHVLLGSLSHMRVCCNSGRAKHECRSNIDTTS